MNIFENAKFGDKFVTRGGRKCIIIEPPYKINDIYRIDYIVKGESGIVSCDINGNVTDVDSNWDIVSRWNEPIDEDKLEKLSEEHVKCFDYTAKPLPNHRALAKASFKIGYRKALEV